MLDRVLHHNQPCRTEAQARADVQADRPKFEKTSCSQCGQEFGPGDHGYSHCDGHRRSRRPLGECSYCDKYGGDPMSPRHEASERCEGGKHPHCTCDVCF